jgi:uncharacterized membrane protein
MSDADGIVIFLGTYDDVEAAREDFEAIKVAKREHFLGDYESALFMKDESGDVKILNTDATERAFGATAGAITGGVIGLLFPPALVATAVAGAGVGAAAGQMMRGLKRKDLLAMGEMLDEGTAGVVLVGFTTMEEGIDRLMKRAAKIMKQQVDADAEELKRAIDAAVES